MPKIKKKQKILLELDSSVLDRVPLGIYVLDQEGKIEYFNPEMTKMAGAKTADEVVGLNVFEMSSYRKSGLDKYLRQGLEGKPFRVESIKYTSYSGEKTTFRHYSGIPINDGAGKLKRLLCIVEDVTDKKKTDDALKESEEKFRALVQLSPDCIKLFDLDGNIFYMNPAGLKEHGFDSLDDLDDWDYSSCIAKGHKSRFLRAFSNVKKGLSVSVLIKHDHGQTDRDWCHISLSPIKNARGKMSSILAVSRDITKLKDVEETLNEKMFELEKMNRLMIGRELKMAELKRKIKTMEKRKSATYKIIKRNND